MRNHVFDSLVTRLTFHFGTGQPLESGTGVRFQSAKRGKLTVYHSNLAVGNQAEVAFEPTTMAKRLSMSERELRSLVGALRSATGREVSPDPQFNWPRVGLADAAHVEVIIAGIEKCLVPPR
jgi:hypothetical protein